MACSMYYVLNVFVALMMLGMKDVTSVFPGEESSVNQDERYLKGRDQYEMMRTWSDSAMPRYSHCWLNALTNLNAGCKRLTDDVQHRLALKFTNCFLLKTGRESYECGESDPLDVCTKDMTSHAYNTYIEFFTHTQNICFFLQAQAWQEETHNTIDKLADSSATVAQQIEDSSELQNQVIHKQNESIRNQEILLERGIELKHTLEESTVDVHHMLQEFKDTTTEQRALLFEVFDRLNALQSVVLGEFTGFYSLIFYAVSVLVSYLLTSTPRTSSARFWLFVLMTVNIAVERLIVMWGTEQTEDPTTGAVIDGNSLMYQRLWWCRKAFCTLAVFLWARCAYSYNDMNKANNKLLVEIRKQNSELKHLLQTGTPPPKMKPLDIVDHHSPEPHNAALNASKLSMISSWTESLRGHDISTIPYKKRDSTSTGYHSDSESDSQSTGSFDSLMTDRTFTVTEVGEMSDSDTESCCTAASWASSLCGELADLREATPVREMAAFFDQHNLGGLRTAELTNSGSNKKRGRPKGSKNKPHTPVMSPCHMSPCQYNLRSQRGVTKSVMNPVVETESAEDFGKMLHHLAQVSKRNKAKVEITLGRDLCGNVKLSSDED